ncbi:pyridine nucleotide-disulfide oxidoreductase family protein [Planococcus antarcticus DSM 14505]|uniref:Pyridine nucleotide-disulfide oxidoreductase n=1 Tax=Planococcus antarcticus DSM 14505 TaxID=1185653 RepID=A0A1C7DHZ1_9BACL|nr:FAD-dependent oxidoreductase [Planococcus antarcticus]ANU11018.1 pyridine nucleotide-disulfide oxidoreductase [Planococcus antarcticus DSM 14505]EIM07051.1 pyridine nucleotide-disulfide oxidoreductase family protein [Planococcus antarcticus DSM 14505]
MKTLVLVGGGHAHLHCLEQLNTDSPKDWRVLLISSSPYQYYSGMFSGYTEGVYSLEDIRIDLKKLCEKIGATFTEDAVMAIDLEAKELTGSDGVVYPYDVVSFDIGSRTDIPETVEEHAASIKPNYRFPDQLVRTRDSAHPVIVGGGASGVELAFSILSWRKQHDLPVNITLFSSTSLLIGQGAVASKKIEAIAIKKALAFFPHTSIQAIDGQSVTTSASQTFPQSDVLWLTGPKSVALFSLAGLPTDAGGFLLVNEALQSVQHPEIFGAGDCITIDRYPTLAKNGVYAVRQGPILWKNLKNSLSKDKLLPFDPQKKFVSILSTGGGEAFLSYGEQHFHGRIPWKIKQHIDRKFMKRYKDLYE